MTFSREPGSIMLLVLSVTAGALATASPSLSQTTALRLEGGPVGASGPAPPLAGTMTPELMQPAGARLKRGNPLWSVPLDVLTATRERPLFSPSRRPPSAPVIATKPVAAPPPPPPPPAPERPNLSLVGTVRAENGSIAVFVDATTQATVRLRPGQNHRGWTLQSVDRRAAELQKGDRTETVALSAAAAPPAPGVPPAGQQTAASSAPGVQQTAASSAPGAQPTAALPRSGTQPPAPPPAQPIRVKGQTPAPTLPVGALPSPPPPPPPPRPPRQYPRSL